MQIKLTTTGKKNEQKEDAKNNAELQNEWTKTIWKTFEENIKMRHKQVYEGLTGDG